MCYFCNQHRETLLHLFVECPIVNNFYNELLSKLDKVHYKINEQRFLDAKSLILGHDYNNADNKEFILAINLTRYVWITKWFEKTLSVKAFQFRFSNFIKLHKKLEDIMCFNDVRLERLWIG